MIQMEFDLLKEDNYCYHCLNFFLDVDIIYNDKGYPICDIDVKLEHELFLIFPFTGNKGVIAKYTKNGICLAISLYDNGEIKQFNTHMIAFSGLPILGKENMPDDVIELLEMQLIEMYECNIFKVWHNIINDDKDYETFERVNLAMTNFRYIYGSVNPELVTHVPTITTKQNRMPNSGIVRC